MVEYSLGTTVKDTNIIWNFLNSTIPANCNGFNRFTISNKTVANQIPETLYRFGILIKTEWIVF